jgi:hypothetical protein
MYLQNLYYTYAYLRKNGTPYYIGKGSGKRAWTIHRYNNKGIQLPKDKSRIVILENNLTEIGAFALERRYIRWYGRKDLCTGILRNKSDGGEGGSNDGPETRRLKARPGLLNGMYGKTHTDEVKQAAAKRAIATFKGKSYEDLYGKEKADDLKKQRSTSVSIARKSRPGHGVNNPNAKKCEVIDPLGNVFIVGALKSFCRENNLSYGLMNAVARGVRAEWKGWVARYP